MDASYGSWNSILIALSSPVRDHVVAPQRSQATPKQMKSSCSRLGSSQRQLCMHSKGMTSIPRKWKGFSGPGAAGDIFPSDSFIEHPNSSFHRRVNYHLVL